MSFDLENALAGLDPEKANAVKAKWHDLESGLTKASQDRAAFERAVQERDGLLQQQQKALQGYETFYNAWAKEQEGKVKNAHAPATRQEVSLPEEYDPNALRQSFQGILDEALGKLNTGIEEKTRAMETGLYGSLGNLVKWQKQLGDIAKFDPEADSNLVIKTAQENNLSDLNAAYRIAYYEKGIQRAAKEAAAQAAKEAATEAEKRVRKELASTAGQIEGAASMGSNAARRMLRDAKDATVPKTRGQAENAATQALYEKMYGVNQ